MPLREFHCAKCKTDFEVLVFGQEKATCPDCGNGRLEQKWSLPAPPLQQSTKNSAPCSRPSCCRLPGKPPCAS